MTKSVDSEFDIIDVEVHQKSVRNIATEMAVTLMRTSGSPVVTDAKDFSTSILDAKVEQLAFAGHVTFHMSTAVAGVQAVLRNNRLEDIRPGDGFICNDPHSSGAIHQGDVGIVMPFFAQGQLVGWGYVNEHVLDVGGSAVSGFAAGAFDIDICDDAGQVCLALRGFATRPVEAAPAAPAPPTALRRVLCLQCGQVFDRRDIAVQIEELNPWITVPESIVTFNTKGDSAFVDVKNGKEWTKTHITTGLSDGINLEVLGGIDANTELKGAKKEPEGDAKMSVGSE